MRPRHDPNGVLPGRLRPFMPFARLTAPQLILAASRASLTEYRDGERVLARGAEDASDYFLLEGSVDLSDSRGVGKTVVAGSDEAARPLAVMRPALYDVTARGRVVCARMARQDVAVLSEPGAAAAECTVEELSETAESEAERPALQEIAAAIRADLAADRLRLPSLPDLALRLRAAVARPNCSNDRIAALVATDPAIAAKLLRMANSPLCRAQEPVTALGDAIGRIGLATVSELVICFALKDLFQCPSRELRREFAERTGEAVRLGAFAAVIARRAAPELVDQALVAGLVSDVGAIPVLERIAELEDSCGGAARVRAVIDHLAPQLGELICRRWGFTPAVAAAVRASRDWAHAVGATVSLADVVVCARYHAWLSLGRTRQLPRAEAVPALAILGSTISPEDSLLIVREAKSRIDALLALLG